MKFFNLIFILLILNYGCYKKQDNIILDKIGDVELEISNKETLTFIQNLVVDGENYITTLDTSINTINFYNIHTNKKKSSINLNSIYNVIIPGNNDILAVNLDSLIVISTLLNKITLVDKFGNKVNEWNIDNSPDYSILSIAPGSRGIFKDNKIILPTYRRGILIDDYLSLNKYYESTTNVILNLRSSSSKELKFFGHFPKAYTKESKNFYNFFPSFSIDNENNIILSFNKDHHVIIYNKEGTLIKEKMIKSKYINEFNDIKLNDSRNFNYLKKYILSEPSYERIVFDEYNNLYYRIVKLPINKLENADGSFKTTEDIDYSIIVLDENLDILDEILVDSKKYYVPGLIPTKNGILLPSIGKEGKHIFSGDIFKVTIK
ncbi:MAG: DUF4221 family protein [Ignavibacterium sp.]|jgi:hypothetical protein|nr:DUF4221 family protein [Ignavibacterium sp.]